MPRPNGPSARNPRAGERERAEKCTCSPRTHTHLDASEDAVSVYSVLGTAEDGGGVVVTLVPCAMAANTKKGHQGSGGSQLLFGIAYLQSGANDFFKAHWAKVLTFLFPSQGVALEAGCSILASPPPGRTLSAQLRFSQEHLRSLCLAQTGQQKPRWRAFIPRKLFAISTAGLTAVSISGMSRMPQVPH